MSAVVAEPAVAKALGVHEGSALLRVSRVCFDADGRPVQFLTGLYHPERYEYHMRLSRVSGDTKVWIQNEPKPSP